MRTRLERLALRHVISRLPAPALRLLAGGELRREGRTLHPLLAAMMRLNAGPGLQTLPPPAARRAYGRIIATADPDPLPLAQADEHRVAVDGGSIRVRRLVPAGLALPAPAIVLFHGGGMVVGDIDQYENTARLVATLGRCVVLNVDYRCGPEHRFPAGALDAIAAYRWLHDNATALGVDPARVAVMGDSAGGYLSAVVAQAVRDRDLPPLKAQCLVYPVVDMRLVSPSIRTLGEGFGLTESLIRWFCANYVRTDADREDPLCSPLLATSHARLAPALITVAGFDPLHDEGVEYARRLHAAGVPVTLLEHDDLTHAWFTMAGGVPPARAAMADTCARLSRMLRA